MIGADWPESEPGQLEKKRKGGKLERNEKTTYHTVLQSKYPNLPSTYYIPKDLWFIRARFLKRGISTPQPVSSNSSRADMEEFRRRVSVMGGTLPVELQPCVRMEREDRDKDRDEEKDKVRDKERLTASATSAAITAATSLPASMPAQIHSDLVHPPGVDPMHYGIFVFVDIQLYALDEANSVVDFKCDGYQNVVLCQPEARDTSGQFGGCGDAAPPHELNGQAGWRPVSRRIANKEKEVTSPYPYLDVVGALVARLASAN